MISIDDIRNIEPSLRYASDSEIETIREKLYELANLGIDSYIEENGSKIPFGLEDVIQSEKL